MTNITFDKNIEPEQKAEIEKYLNPYRWLIPKWCQRVEISIATDENNAAMATTVNYEYRSIALEVYSCWFNQIPEKKLNDVIHELIHFQTAELANYLRGMVYDLTEDEKMRAILRENLRLKNEAMTQDLTYAILECQKQRERTAVKDAASYDSAEMFQKRLAKSKII